MREDRWMPLNLIIDKTVVRSILSQYHGKEASKTLVVTPKPISHTCSDSIDKGFTTQLDALMKSKIPVSSELVHLYSRLID